MLDVQRGSASEAGALARYQRTRDGLNARLFTAVDTIASYRWTMPQLRRSLLEASSAMSEQVETLERMDAAVAAGVAR